MTTYTFILKETRIKEVEIKAETLQAAAAEVFRRYEQVEIELDFGDHAQTTFEYQGDDAPEGFEIEVFYS